MSTAIEWTDATWNPVTGCTKVSPGCANCYIERTPAFRMTGQRFERGRIPVRLHHDRLEQPLRWRKPRRVFVVSMGDLFHEDVPDQFLRHVLMTMALSPQHTYQLLTKRPERMLAFFRDPDTAELRSTLCQIWHDSGKPWRWPLPNVWLGVSVENQRATWRVEELMRTPAAVRFLSCEPLLGPLDLSPWLEPICRQCDGSMSVRVEGGGKTCPRCVERQPLDPDRIDWVIVGGESGPGRAERKLVEPARVPCPVCADDPGGIPGGLLLAKQHNNGAVAMQRCVKCRGKGVVAGWRPKSHALEWLRSIRQQCAAAGIPYFFKQWGGPTPKSGGRLLDGREHNEMPA